MNTRIQRLPAKSQAHATQVVLMCRKRGQSAWAEQDGDQHYVFIRMVLVSAPPSCLRVAHLLN